MTHSDGRSGESEARVEVVMINYQCRLNTFFQDPRKQTQSGGGGERRSSSSGRGRGEGEANLNIKLMKLSSEGARERSSHSTDSQNVKLKEKRKVLEKQGGGVEKSSREDFIENAKSQPCMFFAKGYCMRGNSCWFNHKRPGQIPFVAAGAADDMEKGNFEEEIKLHSSKTRYMMLRLVDYTVTVKTLDLEEYFSQFGEVLEVKFTGLSQEGWSNFNLEVRWADDAALKALQEQSHSIKGIDVMVKQLRSRDSRSCSRGGKEEKSARSSRGRGERRKKRSRSRDSRSYSRREKEKKSEREIERSNRGRSERGRKRSRSKSQVSRTSKGFSKEDARRPEKRWRGNSQSRVEEKEIKQEKRDTWLVPQTDGEKISGGEKVTKVKVKEEVAEVARASDGAPSEFPKESDHLARLLKEDQECGASPKKVMGPYLEKAG